MAKNATAAGRTDEFLMEVWQGLSIQIYKHIHLNVKLVTKENETMFSFS